MLPVKREEDEEDGPRLIAEASRLKPKTTEDLVNERFSDMQAAFRYIDVDNSGTISKEELERALRVWGFVGPNGPDPSIKAVLQACDASGTGAIDYEEFVSAFAKDDYLKHPDKPPPSDPLQGVMSKLRPGVTPAMLRSAHNQIRDKLKTKFGTIARAFRTWDENKNGFLGREEFDFGLKDLNLDGIPRPVIDSLLDIIDVVDDGNADQDHAKDHDIQLREFARVFTVDDLLSADEAVMTKNMSRAPPQGLSPRAPPQGLSPRPPANGRAAASPKARATQLAGGGASGRLGVRGVAPPANGARYRSSGIEPLSRKVVTKKPAALIEEYLAPMKEDVKEMRHAQAVEKLRPGVTEQELRKVQQMIKGKIMDKYSRLDKAFKWMDREREDSNNTLTREELRDGLAGLNLHVGGVIRQPVFETIFDFMDADGDEEVTYAEFARVISAEDVMIMAPILRA